MDERRNPYVGPQPFEREDARYFFGRDREAERLSAMITSDQAVLFYAQSGAGKTSLLNARLKPDLEAEGFEVLPVARVGGESRLGVEPRNVYVWNLLTRLLPEREPAELLSETLAGFLARPGEDTATPRVLIVDQFEEVFATPPRHSDDRAGFFRQLRQALEADPLLSVLLAMREDKIAGLDEFAPLLKNQLRSRLRMERLRRGDALKAAREPAARAGRPFADGVAEELIDNLSLEHAAGRDEPVPGEYVEPVQLQVVCYQLWEFLRSRPGKEIERHDLRAFGDIGRALEDFYDQTVARVAGESGVSEAVLRRWIETCLITPQGLRGQVSREPETTAGLSNAAVDLLVGEHLIREETARGGVWLQVVHDRFIDPIRTSNAHWIPRHVPLAADAQAWKQAGRDRAFLYPGRRLDDAEAWSEEHPALVGGLEREFLEASRRAARERRQRRRRAVRRAWAAGLFILVLVAVLLALLAGRIEQGRALVSTAVAALESDPRQSLEAALDAADTFPVSTFLASDLEDLLRRGLDAYRLVPLWRHHGAPMAAAGWDAGGRLLTVDADGWVKLRDGATGSVAWSPLLRIEDAALVTADPASPRWAFFDLGGGAWLWAGHTVQPLADPPPAEVVAAAFSPDGAHLATVHAASPVLWLWNGDGTLAATSEVAAEELYDVAWCDDGRRLAVAGTGGGEGLVAFFDVSAGGLSAATPPVLATVIPKAHGGAVNAVAWSSGGTRLATAGDDRQVRLWRGGVTEEKSLDQGGVAVDVLFDPTGDFLVAVTADGTGRVWDLRTMTEAFKVTLPALPDEPFIPAVSYRFAPSARRLVRVTADGFEVLALVLPEVGSRPRPESLADLVAQARRRLERGD